MPHFSEQFREIPGGPGDRILRTGFGQRFDPVDLVDETGPVRAALGNSLNAFLIPAQFLRMDSRPATSGAPRVADSLRESRSRPRRPFLRG